MGWGFGSDGGMCAAAVDGSGMNLGGRGGGTAEGGGTGVWKRDGGSNDVADGVTLAGLGLVGGGRCEMPGVGFTEGDMEAGLDVKVEPVDVDFKGAKVEPVGVDFNGVVFGCALAGLKGAWEGFATKEDGVEALGVYFTGTVVFLADPPNGVVAALGVCCLLN